MPQNNLTFAQRLRVHAAAGVVARLEPDVARLLAVTMDRQEALVQSLLESFAVVQADAQRARAAARRARVSAASAWCLCVALAVVCGGVLYVG